MQFSQTLVEDAEGTILAHTTRGDGWTLKKGRCLTKDDCEKLAQGQIKSVLVARLQDGDVQEDEAARRVANRLVGEGVELTEAFTGRCNIVATCAGVVRISAAAVDRINAIHESVTVATLSDYARASEGQIVATVKIIPFAVEEPVMTHIGEEITALRGSVSLAPFMPLRTVLINTTLPTLKNSVKDKTTALTRRRIADVGGTIEHVIECEHGASNVTEAFTSAQAESPDLIVVVGASVTVDRADAVPAGLVQAGAEIVHFGMPVDPGNMMLLARYEGAQVVVLPGCARSPKLNGIDWLLERFAARIDVGAKDVMALGVGGLLIDSPMRPLPRAEAVRPSVADQSESRIAAVVLAGGQSRRMGNVNKLLELVDGVPLVRRTAETVLASHAAQVVVVTGHEDDAVRMALEGLSVTFVYNPEFTDGLSTSLKAGLAGVDDDYPGVLICLADMPAIQSHHLNDLIKQFDPDVGRAIGVPVYRGKRGNPVLWSRRFFEAMTNVHGDVGARHLIGDYADLVYEVEFEDTAILTDLDTPEQWSKFRDTSAS